MQLNIPDDLLARQLVSQIVPVNLDAVETRLELINRTRDLPEYANKTEVKNCLKIGDATLTQWEIEGLKIQQWSEKSFRIEREELKRFLKTKEVG